jgi:photosystem II PsbY protein
MDMDLRPLIVLAPIVLVVGWAAYNIIKASQGSSRLAA